MTKSKISKETCYFALSVIMISLLVFVLANLILGFGVPFQYIITFSVLVSTPLSYLIAGYTRKTLKGRIRKLGLNQGITLVAIFVLTLLPIVQYPVQLIITTRGRLYFNVLPNLVFQTTENTSSVKGQINSTGFFLELLVYENRCFEAEKIVELAITNWGNESIDLQFLVTGLKGNFEFLKELQLSAVQSLEKADVIYVDNSGTIQCNQTGLYWKPCNTLSLDIKCTGSWTLVSNSTLSICLSVLHHEYSLQRINIVFKTTK